MRKQLSNFKITALTLDGLQLIQRNKIGDHRGYLSKIFCKDALRSAGWKDPIFQINHTSTSKKGSVRGFHYQNYPYAEMKLVSCIRGKVLDIAVDLREGSQTFLQWHAEILSDENMSALLIPEGFAHGFQALEDKCELLYLHSQEYKSSEEGGIRYNDPQLDIPWPLEVVEVSERDQNHPLLTKLFLGIK